MSDLNRQLAEALGWRFETDEDGLEWPIGPESQPYMPLFETHAVDVFGSEKTVGLIARMEERGWYVFMMGHCLSWVALKDWAVQLVFVEDNTRTVSATGDTPMQSIAKAALAALKSEEADE